MTSSQKHFKKRDAILQYLHSVDTHPSAEMVYSALKTEIPDLSLATVYRNLNLFRQQGKACCVATVQGVDRFDGNTGPHVHFICNECQAVQDLDRICVPAEVAEKTGQLYGNLVTDCQLIISGVCRDCRKEVSA